MIKGSNRRMFRRPGSARKAAGILASSQDLMNQVEPIRMAPGGFVEEYEKMLLKQMEQKPRGNILTDLGLATAQAALQNPGLETTESLAAGLTQAIPMQTKRQDTEDVRKRAILEGQLKLETAKRAQEKEVRDQATSEAAIFNTLYTNDQREALSMMGFTPDFKSQKFRNAKGDLYSISDIQEDEKLSKQYNAQLDATKTTVGERYLANFQDADNYYDAMNSLAGFAAQQRDEDIAAQDIQRNAPIIADKFAVKTQKRLQEEDPDATVRVQELNVGAYNSTTEKAGAITGGHGATVNVTTGKKDENGKPISLTTKVYDPGGRLLREVTTPITANTEEELRAHRKEVARQVYGVASNSRGLLLNSPTN